MIPKESIDKTAEQGEIESRNIVFLSGSNFSVETAIAFTYRVSNISGEQTLNSSSTTTKKIIQFHLSLDMTEGINSPTFVHAVFTISLTFFLSSRLSLIIIQAQCILMQTWSKTRSNQ